MVREEAGPLAGQRFPTSHGPGGPRHGGPPAPAGDGGSGASDALLLAAIAQGDQRAVAALYDRYGGVAYGLAYRILQDRAAAQDVVQGVFISIWRGAAGSAPGRGGLRLALLTAVQRRAVERLRGTAGTAGHDGLLDEWDRPSARDEPRRAVEGASQRKTLHKGSLHQFLRPRRDRVGVLRLRPAAGMRSGSTAPRGYPAPGTIAMAGRTAVPPAGSAGAGGRVRGSSVARPARVAGNRWHGHFTKKEIR